MSSSCRRLPPGGAGFQIPMRGNEVSVTGTAALVSGFQIPMRGNEMLRLAYPLQEYKGFKSP